MKQCLMSDAIHSTQVLQSISIQNRCLYRTDGQ